MNANNTGHLLWIVLGPLIGIIASFIFGDLLSLPDDLYYLIYFVLAGMLFAIYAVKTRLNLKEWFIRRLLWEILFGLIFAAVIIQHVLSKPATRRFTGLYVV
jgi:hypothetical protein